MSRSTAGRLLQNAGCLLVGAALSISAVSYTSVAHAAPKDDKALKSFKQAMEEDYLDTKFDEAEKKLKGALDICGSSGCSPAVKAKIYMGLGVVLIGGKGKKDEGVKAFSEGLKLDASAAPDPDYITSDIKTAYDEAKKSAGSGNSGSNNGSSNPPPSGQGMTLAPIPEQRLNTPVPIYVTLDEETAKKVVSVIVTYKAVGGDEERTLELEKSGKAFRGNIPCNAVTKKGTLQYWIVGKDKKGKEAGSVGSSGDLLATEIKADVDGKAPSWPGFAPPEPCKGDVAAPEDSGSSHRQCVDNKDCPDNEQCTTNECLRKPGESGSKPPEEKDDSGAKLNWIRLSFSPDFAMISGEDVCGFTDAYAGGTPEAANDPTYVCVRNPDGENRTRYLGMTTPGQGNNVNFGFGVATMRLMLGYDRVLIKGLSIGARIGWAFNGTNEEFASFIPVHAEGRLAYTIGANPFAGQVVRPWVYLAGGLMQVDTAVAVDVLEDGVACGADDPGDPASACTVASSDGVLEPRIQTLRAIKQGGLGFAGLGVGVSFVPVDLFEINVGVKFSVTFPYVVPVFSPEVGVGIGF